MKSIAALTISLAKKDLTLEARRGELSVLSLLSIIGLGFILGYGTSLVGLSEATRTALSPVFALALLFISALSFGGKLAEYDREGGALEGLVTAGVPAESLYSARVLSLTLLYFGTGLLAFISIPVLLSLPTERYLPQGTKLTDLLGMLLGVCVGLSALIALVAPIAIRVRAGAAFILALTLPLALPLFFAGCEITGGALETKPFWWSVVVGLDLMYVAGGLWLHSFLMKRT